jgi:hypothetical protein
MRFVSTEKKKRIQYDMDKRREEQGKTVIHMHEQPPKFKVWPSCEFMQGSITKFFESNGSLPSKIIVPFRTSAPTMAYPVTGLPFEAEWELSGGRGRLVEMVVSYDPEYPEVTLA